MFDERFSGTRQTRLGAFTGTEKHVLRLRREFEMTPSCQSSTNSFAGALLNETQIQYLPETAEADNAIKRALEQLEDLCPHSIDPAFAEGHW